VKWLLVTTDKFPKKARFTFTDRLVGLSLSIIEDLVEARYTRNKSAPLRHANLTLEKLRVVLRVCYETQILSKDASFKLNEVGKMLGGCPCLEVDGWRTPILRGLQTSFNSDNQRDALAKR
jgi:hypothetical protein